MSTPTVEFRITRDLAAPRHLAWRAWTDPAVAATWWHPNGVTVADGSVEIDLRVGGGFRYTMVAPDGTTYPTGGTYLEVDAPRRLRFTWRDTADSDEAAPVITVDLDETTTGTAMTFHLAVRRAVLDDVRTEPGATMDSMRHGWAEAFDELDDALTRLRVDATAAGDR